MKRLMCFSTIFLLSGCYSNWPALDKASKAIECEMDAPALVLLSKKYNAIGLFDEVSNSFSIAKDDDAIGIAFNANGKITTIAKTKSIISLGGIMRRQGDVVIVNRCIK
jgi:hypothetical protein